LKRPLEVTESVALGRRESHSTASFIACIDIQVLSRDISTEKEKLGLDKALTI
jgi:hypothetical protein